MREARPNRFLLFCAISVSVCAAAVAIWHLGFFELGYYLARASWHSQTGGMQLSTYRAVIDGRRIEGIADNASGLTYNPYTGTLFAVINRPPQVAELSVEGKLLRLMPLRGAVDLEGITHVDADHYVIADEGAQRLFYVHIAADAAELRVAPEAQLTLDLGWEGNRGLEGLSSDGRNGRLYAVKEKEPLRVLAIDGLAETLSDRSKPLRIAEWPDAEHPFYLLKDLSSLNIHEPSGHMLLLSDESRLLVEYDVQGRPVGVLPLRKGWRGLSASVPDAEGVAIGPGGEIYVVSEPNLFYRFERFEPAL